MDKRISKIYTVFTGKSGILSDENCEENKLSFPVIT